jgi:hypothetical protein
MTETFSATSKAVITKETSSGEQFIFDASVQLDFGLEVPEVHQEATNDWNIVVGIGRRTQMKANCRSVTRFISGGRVI